ncbi:MarR family winged helix-turn-helix transcriptional regulator [Nocardia implantans]|uniref:MarR family winged helix-turn-helix transcriptional regulator n=1 Tax=Nocardia implantans TaxID=3108168 RepID=A0ABU6B192_9NOCA|nr:MULTISPECIES: MarR family winged helix-turn-helix transcriptional regulator [unclassified Nocardia]MBF6195526.1 winged helix-turn-helix transcriptional regulator [Nocardia beijingensis]MEA3531964.1 MarR family winged helix-turn-helix transcriptional regulator [Nocardia sp. CDC192]MEB3513446.1 MarR family winged helix-turn-helix transcriptional regulator [Nocardia sp. CDC186]
MSDSGPGDKAALNRLTFELSLLSRHFPAALLRRPGFQLDRSAYLILTRLELDHPLSLRELSEAFQLDVSTINRQVGAMRKQGLVERVPDPDGGIARKIRASAKGLELLAADRKQSRQGIGAVVAEWTEADIDLFSRLIARFNQSVEDKEANPWPRPAELD